MKLAELVSAIESHAHPEYQESYDNAGLAVGNNQMEVHAALLCIDIRDETVDEAISLGADVIISHHPLIFNPLKNLNENNPIARIISKAIRHHIAIYSAHTNIDNMIDGVNHKICQKLHLINQQILFPLPGELRKLVVFVPTSHSDHVRKALFAAGAGKIGTYDHCSYNVEGFGTFRGTDHSNPYVGEKGKLHLEKEVRIETVFPKTLQPKIIAALLEVHPYEEPAYDIYPLDNVHPLVGSGMTGELENPLEEMTFLQDVKKIFNCKIIRHSSFLNKPVKKIAVCGGSGSFLIPKAIGAKADVFITADLKYHDFFQANGKIVLADIGHYESEQFTIELFYEILTKNFHNFEVHFTKIISNPINYL